MAAGSTYTPIATSTLGSAAASYTFSSISGSYTDLVLVATISNTAGSYYQTQITVNGDTGNNYSNTDLYGTGSAAASGRRSNWPRIEMGWTTSSSYVPTIVNFQNYSNTTTYKTVVGRSSDPSNRVTAAVGLWRNTAAITSITIACESGANFTAGSTFTLYGIASA